MREIVAAPYEEIVKGLAKMRGTMREEVSTTGKFFGSE
jgi:hypothetical protein